MAILILGLILFLGVHSVRIVAPDIRAQVVERAGAGAWKGAYAGVAATGFVLIVVGYWLARHEVPILYYPPVGLRHLALVIMLPVFPLLLATYLRGRVGQALGHPMLIATILWAAAHLMANGSLADALLFGGFLVWAALDWRSAARREGAASPRTAMSWTRNDAIAVAGGLAVYLAFLGGLHFWLFGVSPL